MKQITTLVKGKTQMTKKPAGKSAPMVNLNPVKIGTAMNFSLKSQDTSSLFNLAVDQISLFSGGSSTYPSLLNKHACISS